MKNNAYCLVVTTSNELNNAEAIAEILVRDKLAACVQIDKVSSYYIFEEKFEKSDEYRLFIKTIETNYLDVESLIKRLHNYSVPQIIKLEIKDGCQEYLKWLDASCKR